MSGLKISFLSQILHSELKNLYETAPETDNDNEHGFIGMYSHLYDYLINEGHKIDFPDEKKKQLYQLAKKRLISQYPKWMKLGKCEFNDRKLKDMYKSFLVRRYLADKLNKENVKLTLDTPYYSLGTINWDEVEKKHKNNEQGT